MISGVVTAEREVVIPLVIAASDAEPVAIEAVLDTGFNGFLTLPAAFLRRLSLLPAGSTTATLGDGRSIELSVYEVSVLWDGEPQQVTVLEAEGGALVGMAMLVGYRLTIDVEIDGFVQIVALPSLRSSAQA